MINNIYNENCIETLKRLGDNSVDLVFTDPPYALGSQVIIKDNGKPDYKGAVDFMGKWVMPGGEFWESWFKEVFRVLKYGGHCLVFGMDRQLLVWKYYGALSGFTECQGLYWYYVTGFPKATDLSKMIDKRLGSERLDVGHKSTGMWGKSLRELGSGQRDGIIMKGVVVSKSQSDLGQKYEGYKYSIAPLKQTCETIMVFQKPYKTGSCLSDVLAMEGGDKEITCGALNIDDNRMQQLDGSKESNAGHSYNFTSIEGHRYVPHEKGYHPSQTCVDSGAARILYNQGGVGDSSCVKNLYKCDYEKGDYDVLNYIKKVDGRERVIGEGVKNLHITLKPIKLCERILKLFKSPDRQVLLDPFMGSGTVVVAGIGLGYDYIGVELDEEYFKTASFRIERENKLNGRVK